MILAFFMYVHATREQERQISGRIVLVLCFVLPHGPPASGAASQPGGPQPGHSRGVLGALPLGPRAKGAFCVVAFCPAWVPYSPAEGATFAACAAPSGVFRILLFSRRFVFFVWFASFLRICILL